MANERLEYTPVYLESSVAVDLEEAGSDQNLLASSSSAAPSRTAWRCVRPAASALSIALTTLVVISFQRTVVHQTRIRAHGSTFREFELQEAESEAFNVTSSAANTWQYYWNSLEGNKQWQEALEEEERMEEKLESDMRDGIGDIKNQTEKFNRHRMHQRLKHSLQNVWDSAEDLARKTKKYKTEVKGLMKTKVYLNGTTSHACPELDGLYIEKVLHSNLGGKGPQPGEPSMILLSNHTEDGLVKRQLAFKVTATTPYTPGWTQMNGVSQGLVGKYGQITIKPGTSVRLKIQTFDTKTNELVHLPTAAFTFFDLDMAAGGEQVEFLTAGGYDRVETTANTEVRRMVNVDNTTRFEASTVGTFDDNPVDPLLLTEQQKNRAVTLIYSNVDEVEVVLGAGAAKDPGAWRCFEFVLHPVLACAKTLTDAQHESQGIPLPVVMLIGLIGILLVLCVGWWCCC